MSSLLNFLTILWFYTACWPAIDSVNTPVKNAGWGSRSLQTLKYSDSLESLWSLVTAKHILKIFIGRMRDVVHSKKWRHKNFHFQTFLKIFKYFDEGFSMISPNPRFGRMCELARQSEVTPHKSPHTVSVPEINRRKRIHLQKKYSYWT